MTPETKEVFDTLMVVLGPAGLAGVGIGLFGFLKARAEKTHIAKPDQPQLSTGTLAHLGGMMMNQQVAQDMIEALQAMASSHNRCSQTRETEMELRKKLFNDTKDFVHEVAKEEREFRRRIASDQHEQARVLSDDMKRLSDRLNGMNCNA